MLQRQSQGYRIQLYKSWSRTTSTSQGSTANSSLMRLPLQWDQRELSTATCHGCGTKLLKITRIYLQDFTLVAGQATENSEHEDGKNSHLWQEEHGQIVGLSVSCAFVAMFVGVGCQPGMFKKVNICSGDLYMTYKYVMYSNKSCHQNVYLS